jgi:hypothetical protein
VDLSTDTNNCGQCGMQCDTCANGQCANNCPQGTQDCNGSCLTQQQLKNDPQHCGQCGNQCDVNRVCTNGQCRGYFAPPGCNACPCPQCGVGTTCCTLPGGGYPVCVNGTQCPM